MIIPLTAQEVDELKIRAGYNDTVTMSRGKFERLLYANQRYLVAEAKVEELEEDVIFYREQLGEED